METESYAVGQAVLGAHSVGAPHKRQRLYWLGVSDCGGRESRRIAAEAAGHGHSVESASCLGVTLGDAKREGLQRLARDGNGGDKSRRIGEDSVGSTPETSTVGELADVQSAGRENDLESRQKEMLAGTDAHGIAGVLGDSKGDNERRNSLPGTHGERQSIGGSSGNCNSSLAHSGHGERCAEQRNELRERDSRARESSAWSDYDLIYCRDDKFRRVEAGTFPLATGISGRVGLLRGYGNAIVPPLAAQFIQASLEAINEVEKE